MCLSTPRVAYTTRISYVTHTCVLFHIGSSLFSDIFLREAMSPCNRALSKISSIPTAFDALPYYYMQTMVVTSQWFLNRSANIMAIMTVKK